MKDRRAQIVQAATAVMGRQGYSQTSIDDVIREARLCGKGHFYHYFRSKEELGYEVLRRQFEMFVEHGLTILRDPLVDPMERLDRFIDDVVNRHVSSGGCKAAGPCGALVTEMADQHDGFRRHADALFERWLAQLQALLWEARPRLVEGVDTERLARFIVATLEGALFISRVKQDVAGLQGIAEELKRFVATHVRMPSPVEESDDPARARPLARAVGAGQGGTSNDG
ncbi:MAG TPA: TetR/AcrR family transcriptional regulator [Gemmatimonadaceae bacterium]|nr:TetR/AcrR family transcriptional regulator [Gemmatimonadaceae bacterium]